MALQSCSRFRQRDHAFVNTPSPFISISNWVKVILGWETGEKTALGKEAHFSNWEFQESNSAHLITVSTNCSVSSHVQLCNPMSRTIACQASLSMGFFQARILEWVAISSSRGSSQPRDQTGISYVSCRFFATEPPGKLPVLLVTGSISTSVLKQRNRNCLS